MPIGRNSGLDPWSCKDALIRLGLLHGDVGSKPMVPTVPFQFLKGAIIF